MGRKLKLATLLVLFLVYFFPLIYSSPAYGLHLGPSSSGPASSEHPECPLQRPARGLNLPGDPLLVEGPEEGPYLLSSMGTRFGPNRTAVLPEGSRVLVVFSKPLENLTITLDGQEAPLGARLKLTLGSHLLEAHWANGSAYRTIQVITQEAYEAMQQEEVEPAGLRLKASILALLSALGLGVPLGAYLKRKRAKPAEL